MRVFSECDNCAGVVTKIEPSPKSNELMMVTVLLDNGQEVTHRDMNFDELVAGQLRLSQVKHFTRGAHYSVSCSFGYIETMLAAYTAENSLVLEPDFQRAHVWTTAQRTKYVEYLLRGGTFGKDIYFNAAGFPNNSSSGNPMELVDGLQRLTTMRQFMAGELPAFGQTYNQYHPEDQRHIKRGVSFGFTFHVNDLKTRVEVLNWYLDLNTGGTPHTAKEIARVRALLAAEESKIS